MTVSNAMYGTVTGPGNFGDRHDLDILAHVTLGFAVQFPGGATQDGQVVRAILLVTPFWSAANMAALAWKRGYPRQVQLAKT